MPLLLGFGEFSLLFEGHGLVGACRLSKRDRQKDKKQHKARDTAVDGSEELSWQQMPHAPII